VVAGALKQFLWKRESKTKNGIRACGELGDDYSK